jgi:hypothetical protein
LFAWSKKFLFQKMSWEPLESVRMRDCALDEVLLVGAGCVNRRSLSSSLGLAAATKCHVGASEESTEDAHSELFNTNVSQSIAIGKARVAISKSMRGLREGH